MAVDMGCRMGRFPGDLLATLAQRWQTRLVPGHPVEMEAQATATLRPKYGIRMTLKQREPSLTPQTIGQAGMTMELPPIPKSPASRFTTPIRCLATAHGVIVHR
jgi:hypothetical protein